MLNKSLTKSDFLVVSDSALALLALDVLAVEEYVVLLLECFFVLYQRRISFIATEYHPIPHLLRAGYPKESR